MRKEYRQLRNLARRQQRLKALREHPPALKQRKDHPPRRQPGRTRPQPQELETGAIVGSDGWVAPAD